MSGAVKEGREEVCKWLIDDMIRKQLDFNKRAIVTFLGIAKKSDFLRLIGHDMVRSISRMVFEVAKKENVNTLEQINTIEDESLRSIWLNYYEAQLHALEVAHHKRYDV